MLDRVLALKQRLRAGRTAIGAWISFHDPSASELMARAGFDYLIIDAEHTPWSLGHLQAALMGFNGTQTVPFVRVPWNDQVMIKQALDLGVEGIMAPMVRTPDEVRALVAACKYPPDGRRGFAPRRASNYFRDIDAYMAVANDAVFVMPQVEDIATVEDIDDYLDVPGIDAVCIGPNDLSGTMGLMRQTGHADVRAAIDRVYAAAKARGIPASPGVTMPADELADLAAKGCRMFIATGDLDLLVRGAPAAAAEVRAAVGP